MDPINIIVGLNIIASFGANLTGAKKGLKSTVTPVKERSKTYLQKLPLALATLTLVVLILSVCQVGTLSYPENLHLNNYRITGLIIYLLFSWIQIWSYKSLGQSYSQEIVVFKDHKLAQKGPFRFIRHPQYLSQMLVDLGGAAATLSYILLPLAVIQIPILIIRASFEEKLLSKHFKEEFEQYKKSRGFMIPFIK
jgi:protein-S-isoprenylcysteine O-methyltransferase Ste14